MQDIMQKSLAIKDNLDNILNQNDTVFIVPHNRPDMDAIGSAIGMGLICKKNKKKCYIVIDDNLEKIEVASKKVIEEVKDEFDIIKASDVNELITDKSLLIAVDVNKDYLISVKSYLEQFHDIFVLDHHKTDEHTIKTPYLFTYDDLSSTCEEVSRQVILHKVKITPEHANYLLAGIILDTNKLTKNVSPFTLLVASELLNKGADATVANNMFLEDFEHDRIIQRLVDNTSFPSYVYAIAADSDDSGRIYEVEDIAKASDYLLKYQVNATFAMAHIDEDTVSISARSKGIIDVSKIMALFGGGGNEHSAAARIKGKSIEDIKKKLNEILIPTSYLDIVIGQENTNNDEMKLTLKNN